MRVLVSLLDTSTYVLYVGFIPSKTKKDTVQELLQKMKEDTQLWHNLLWYSSGNLELLKCDYHCIHYTFQKNCIPVMINTVGNNVKLKIADSQEIKIEAKNIY